MAATELLRRPDQVAWSVEDLVAMVLRGEVRIPVFLRPLKWTATQVIELFDSIYRGFPIGSLLLRADSAPASEVRIGPLTVFADENRRALWVVDGQQRLTSLAASLARRGETPRTPDDPYVIYFDPTGLTFHMPPADGKLPEAWVPLPKLLNASDLGEWIFAWPRGRDASLRALVFDAGRRLREYKVPSYVIETDDEQTLRTIFIRVNSTGTRLEWTEIYDALYGHKVGVPASLADLATELESVGMGRPDEDSQLLPSLVAMRGLDSTRAFGEQVHSTPDALAGVAEEGVPVLRAALGFLRTHCDVPHLRLLPYSTPLIVLTRFFALHPEPNPRTQTLLVRWVWRTFVARGFEETMLQRRGVAAVVADEEGSAQSLLELVTRVQEPSSVVLDRFDPRAADSRLAILGLTSLQPRTLQADTAVDVAALIRSVDTDAFRPLFAVTGQRTSSPANRILLPGSGSARNELVAFIESVGVEHPVLRSHAITADAAAALLRGDSEHFIEVRRTSMTEALTSMAMRLAEWGRSDRPSIDYLLAQADE